MQVRSLHWGKNCCNYDTPSDHMVWSFWTSTLHTDHPSEKEDRECGREKVCVIHIYIRKEQSNWKLYIYFVLSFFYPQTGAMDSCAVCVCARAFRKLCAHSCTLHAEGGGGGGCARLLPGELLADAAVATVSHSLPVSPAYKPSGLDSVIFTLMLSIPP